MKRSESARARLAPGPKLVKAGWVTGMTLDPLRLGTADALFSWTRSGNRRFLQLGQGGGASSVASCSFASAIEPCG